jgi:hypothetical protein
MGTGHLEGREPWFWVSADRTLHLQVAACPDGYVVSENEANARLIAAAPDLLAALQKFITVMESCSYYPDTASERRALCQAAVKAKAAIFKATGEA